MNDRAQRVLDALTKFDADSGYEYPITSISKFFGDMFNTAVNDDYEALTAEEEKQVIKAFLEFAY
jgi:hypothetical protein|nr:MAG TPA: hypothetical protein [Caudoviricetes sp.]